MTDFPSMPVSDVKPEQTGFCVYEVDIVEASAVVDHTARYHIPEDTTFAQLMAEIEAYVGGRSYCGHITTNDGIAIYIQ